MGVGGQRHAPAALPPGKTRYPLYKSLVGPQDRSGRVRKISPPTDTRSPDHPARSELLYRLSYPSPRVKLVFKKLDKNGVIYVLKIVSLRADIGRSE